MKKNTERIKLEKITRGIEKVAQALIPTYGPNGGNRAVEELLPPFFSITNDGKKITDAVVLELPDDEERMGGNILKEATDKADKKSGNGRKTTSLLAYKILKEGYKHRYKWFSPSLLKIKKSIDDCLPIITKTIDDYKKPITTSAIGKVASVAAENPVIGEKVGEIYKSIGRDGIIEVDPSHLPDTFYELIEGVRLHGAKMLGTYAENEKDAAVFKNPKILVTKEKIISRQQIEVIIGKLIEKGIFELVIYCEDIEPAVSSTIARAHITGKFKSLIIKSPLLFKKWLYEDICAITGATPVDSNQGKTFNNISIEDLGTCEKIVCTSGDDGETKVFGGKDITKHIEDMKERIAKGSDETMRLAWLQTKAAILKIGAHSDGELSYLIKKAKDGCSSAYWALQDGTVDGGGKIFLKCIDELPDTIGGKILKNALSFPYEIIGDTGEDVQDAAAIAKQCINNAVSIAGTVLTIVGASAIPEKIKNAANVNPFR